MIAGKKLLFVARRKLTLFPDNCKNDTAEFRSPFLRFMAGLVASLFFASIPSCRYLTLVTLPGWCLGNYFFPANMNFSD